MRRRYINFGALCLGFLNVSQLFAEYRDDENADDYTSSIDLIEGLMTVLTYGLFLSFGGVAIKKAVVKARDVDKTKLLEKVRNIRSSSAAAAKKVTAGTAGTGADNETSAPSSNFAAGGFDVEEAETLRLDYTNPMRTAKPQASLEMRALGAKQAETSMTVDGDAETLPLPGGWTKETDTSGRTYYANRVTQATSWVHPATAGSA